MIRHFPSERLDEFNLLGFIFRLTPKLRQHKEGGLGGKIWMLFGETHEYSQATVGIKSPIRAEPNLTLVGIVKRQDDGRGSGRQVKLSTEIFGDVDGSETQPVKALQVFPESGWRSLHSSLAFPNVVILRNKDRAIHIWWTIRDPFWRYLRFGDDRFFFWGQLLLDDVIRLATPQTADRNGGRERDMKRNSWHWSLLALLPILGCASNKPEASPNLPAAVFANKVIPSTTEVAPKLKRIFEKPKHVRGIYLTAWSAGGKKKRANTLAFIDRTEINSVVIDIRDDGIMYWKTGIPLAKQVGAERIAILNAKKVMDDFEAAKVYPIARIACFRDAFVPKKMPERAVQLSKGGIWKDHSGHTWLDPYNKKNWEYLAQTVVFALDQGFPEIQLDYVRFPSEGKASTQVFPAKKSFGDGKVKPEDVIAQFAEYIGKKVRECGAVYSADIFGIISSGKGDQGIGQSLEKVAEPFDLVCPMIYPSHFAKGEYGIKDPNVQPYLIVKKSLTDYKKRLPDKQIRPWLQDFFGYTTASIKAQIKAAKELGYEEYLIWNAGNKYTEAAVKDNSNLLATRKRAKG